MEQYLLQIQKKRMKGNQTPVGIVGQGFVGSAVRAGLDPHFNVMTYDKYEAHKTTHQPVEIIQKCEVIFVCVPTPMDMETGECHIGIVDEVVQKLDGLTALMVDSGKISHRPVLVVKSTVPPGTIEFLNSRVDYVDVTFNPDRKSVV